MWNPSPGHLPVFHVGADFLVIRDLRDLRHPPITRVCRLGRRGRCLDGCRCRGLGLVWLPGAPFVVHGVVEPSSDKQGFRHLVLDFLLGERQHPQGFDGAGGKGQGDAPGRFVLLLVGAHGDAQGALC